MDIIGSKVFNRFVMAVPADYFKRTRATVTDTNAETVIIKFAEGRELIVKQLNNGEIYLIFFDPENLDDEMRAYGLFGMAVADDQIFHVIEINTNFIYKKSGPEDSAASLTETEIMICQISRNIPDSGLTYTIDLTDPGAEASINAVVSASPLESLTVLNAIGGLVRKGILFSGPCDLLAKTGVFKYTDAGRKIARAVAPKDGDHDRP